MTYKEYQQCVAALSATRNEGSLSVVSYTEALQNLQEIYSIPSVAEAKDIMGEKSVLGPEEVEKCFAITLSDIPPIPFSRVELENAKRLGHLLILRIDRAADGEPLSM